MTLRPLVVLGIIALALLAGCATVSFKRGAGPGNAKADEDACRATTASPEAYADCLREHGWMVSTPGEGTSAPTESVPEAAVEAAPAPAPAKAAAPAAAAAKPAPAVAPVVPPAASAPAATPPPAQAKGTAGKVSAPEPVPAPLPAAPASAKKPLDPATKVTVSSWWKMGGTNADLDAAVKVCVDELGPAHAPNVGPTEVTVALRDCLRGKKWFAVGGTGGVGAERFTR